MWTLHVTMSTKKSLRLCRILIGVLLVSSVVLFEPASSSARNMAAQLAKNRARLEPKTSKWNHLAVEQHPTRAHQNGYNEEAVMMPSFITSHYQHHHQMKRSVNMPQTESAERLLQEYHQKLKYSITLDAESNLVLSWTPNYEQREVRFQLVVVQAPPASWFAVGFSDRGNWTDGADLCVAWEDWTGSLLVQDGRTDEKGIIHGHQKPNRKCLAATFRRSQDERGAVIEFRRPFDVDEGYAIEDGTTHIVYGSGVGPLYQLDGVSPASSECTGFQRIRLLKPDRSVQISDQRHRPSDLRPLLIANQHLRVPADETTYWCRVVRLPEHFQKKHHVVQFEAAIEAGRESLVHHMEVFHCEAPADQVIPDYHGRCSDPQRPEATKVCKRVLAAWAFGAGPFVYPSEAGLPVGGSDFNPYVMLEMHYNNPALRDDWVDSSGVRLLYTARLREHDAGVMELGLEYTDKMAVPPGLSTYTLTGFCLPQCTAVSLPKTGITVFGSQLHTHLLGKRVVTRHFRGPRELPELDRDNHYSTHYQEIRLLTRPVHVLPGDALLTTCWYDSSDRTNVTLGGFAISDEMCVNYVHYYPRVNLEVCKSSISWHALYKYFGFLKRWEQQGTDDENAKQRRGVSDNYGSIEWTPLRSKTLMDYYNRATVSMQCNQSSGDRFPGHWEGLEPYDAPPVPPTFFSSIDGRRENGNE